MEVYLFSFPARGKYSSVISSKSHLSSSGFWRGPREIFNPDSLHAFLVDITFVCTPFSPMLSFLPCSRFVHLLWFSKRDGSAKFWQLNGEASCVATLPDHENGVSVLGLPNGDVATGSTGKQQDGGIAGCCVRLWRHTGDAASSSSGGWSCVATHEDHAGPVRSLCLASASTAAGSGSDGGSDGGSIYAFASTSNDGTITVRSPGGDPLHTVVHPSSGRGENFVYGAAPLVSAKQGFVSISEDCSAAVWSVPQAPSSSSSGSSGGCEVVEHPDGVWCCCALPEEGDFATGCNDGIVRLWTRDPARAASPAAREAAAEAVAAAKASRQGGPSPEEVAKLPQWANRLATPGRGEGDVKVFNKNGVAVAAQWAAASSDWIEVSGCAQEHACVASLLLMPSVWLSLNAFFQPVFLLLLWYICWVFSCSEQMYR